MTASFIAKFDTNTLQPSGGSILVIDDEPGMRQVLMRFLERENYTLYEAANGREGLQVYERVRPDVVLLDAMMPGLDGFEVCERLQTLYRHAPPTVIMVTALADQDAVDLAFAAGAADFITKPINWAVLRQRVRRLLLAKRHEEKIGFLASLVEFSNDAILGHSLDGTILSWNRAAERVFGFTREEIIGQNVSILIPPDRTHEIDEMCLHLGEVQATEPFETIRIRKSGEWFDVALTISPIRNIIGEVVGVSVIARDISERKRNERELYEYRYQLETLVVQRTAELTAVAESLQADIDEQNWAEKAVRQSEEKLRRLTDNMLDIICQINTHGVIEYASPSCWSVLGYPPEWMVGESFYSLVHGDDRDRVMVAIQSDGRAEYRYQHADGHYLWMETLSNVLFEEQGQLAGYILGSRDISARKLAAEALLRSEERFRQLAENIDEVFWVSSADQTQVIYVSPAYERVFGRPFENSYDRLFFEGIHAEDYDRILASLQRQSHGNYDEEYRIIRPDGEIRWIRNRAFPIRNEMGEIYRLVGVMDDITERKRVEQELQEINRLKTVFLSTAAHELRTPLTSIQGFSEILLTRQLEPARQKRYMSLINEQSTHLARIVDDLLNVSRLEAMRHLALNVETVNMADLINNVLIPFTESSPAHPITVQGLESCPGTTGDPFRLSQVVKNLVSNAVKYSPNGGPITIRGACTPGFLQISVQDSGIGITREQQSHLFEKFYRADASNTAIGGTGLGLAISKLIIELHGGKIWAESEYQHGSTFFFTLPLPGEKPVEEAAQPSNARSES